MAGDERTVTGKYRSVGFLGPTSSVFTLAWLASHRDRPRTFMLGGKRLSVLAIWDSKGAAPAARTPADEDAIRTIVHGGQPAGEARVGRGDELLLERDVLRDELDQARDTIEFLHGCLTDERFRYAYPEHTVDDLADWDRYWPRSEACVHSATDQDCRSCADRVARAEREQRWRDLRGA